MAKAIRAGNSSETFLISRTKAEFLAPAKLLQNIIQNFSDYYWLTSGRINARILLVVGTTLQITAGQIIMEYFNYAYHINLITIILNYFNFRSAV